MTTVIVFGIPFLAVMLGVCFSLIKQLRAEPVVSTVPPGVRTLVSSTSPAAALSENGDQSADAPTSAGPTRT